MHDAGQSPKDTQKAVITLKPAPYLYTAKVIMYEQFYFTPEVELEASTWPHKNT
jgi:hypothetical protein